MATETEKTTETTDLPVVTPVATPEMAVDAPRWLVRTLTILAYGIPLTFLAYVLYINYLPFGYNKTFTIDVGAIGDTDSSQPFYLEPSPSLSGRKVTPDGTTYRELNGIAYAVFKPNVVLKDAKITVEVVGEGVSIIPPVIDFDPDSVKWDYEWDFTRGKTPQELGLVGNAFPFDGSMYFDGKSRLELPDSADKFEDGPFSVYVEWTPEEGGGDFQQIVGHFNWEVLQNSSSVSFQVGRMSNNDGSFYVVEYPIASNFFRKRHSLIATYSPSSNGYIELTVDGIFAERTYLDGNQIWSDYSWHDLSFGRSKHGAGKNLLGHILKSSFTARNYANQSFSKSVLSPTINRIPIVGDFAEIVQVNILVHE